MISERARAKINLFLHVGPRRADGYHALESLVCFAEAGDELRFAPSDTLELSVDGPFSAGLAGEDDNLILRAARALAARAGTRRGARIALTKNLPVASGIGGGSADAAAALRGLKALWGVEIGDAALHEIALALGSDVPVCVNAVSAFMRGRGEGVEPTATLPSAPMLLVNPGVAVSTREVFRRMGRTEADRLRAAPQLPPGPLPLQALVGFLQHTSNDMEPYARSLAPAIGDVLAAIHAEGALVARMCGSGATCYGLFESEAAVKAAAAAITSARPDWWVCATKIAA